MGNVLLFQAAPLGAAFDKIEGRYEVDMVLEDEALLESTVTAKFDGQTKESVLHVS